MIGALLGLFGSVFPSLIKLFQDWQDKKHELKLLELQMQYAEKMQTWKMEEVRVESEAKALEALYKMSELKEFKPVGIPSVDKLRGILDILIYVYRSAVQPNVTYLLVLFYGLIKYASYGILLEKGIDPYQAIASLWTDFDYEILGFCITFWFGGRLFQRAGHYKEK